MTDRQKKLIEFYIPSPRDPELDWDEYYVEDLSGRVQRGWITSICPHKDDTLYQIFNKRGQIKSGHDYDGFYKWEMYDNKKDCKEHSHGCYTGWEDLRKIQQEEQQNA